MTATKKTDLFVSAVVALHDDADIVTPALTELHGVLAERYANYEIVVVDDASTDDTAKRVEALLKSLPCMRLLRTTRPMGLEIALTAGLESSIGDWVAVVQPASDPAMLIPEWIDRARKEGAEVVYGRIPAADRPTGTAGVLDGAFHAVAGRLGLPIDPSAAYFRVMNRRVVNDVLRSRERVRHLRLSSVDVGGDVIAVPYTPLRRRAERRPTPLAARVDRGISVLTAFSPEPLRFVTRLGLAGSALNLAYIGYVFAVNLFKKTSEGWTTLSLQNAVMFFALFLILAVLAEYVGRLIDEQRERPLYHLKDEKLSAVMVADATRRNVVGESRDEAVAGALAAGASVVASPETRP